MRRHASLLGIVLAGLLSGCAIVPQRYQLAAEALEAVPNDPSDPNAAKLPAIDKVHHMVQDSQDKCAAFVNSLFAETAGSSFALDVLSTTTSALATAFTAVPTTHALSAASTVFSGGRASLSAEYLNSLSIAHVAQAIQTTYSSDMQKYITYLNGITDPSKVDPYAERSTILSFHNECSLANAEGSISSSLQPPAGSPSGPMAQTYTVGSAETLRSVASGVSAGINANSSFVAAGIKALPGSTAGEIDLTMTAPVALTVSVSPADHKENAAFNAGPPPKIRITGTPRKGDSITVTLPAPAAAAPAAGAPAPVPAPAVAPPSAAPVAAPPPPPGGAAGHAVVAPTPAPTPAPNGSASTAPKPPAAILGTAPAAK